MKTIQAVRIYCDEVCTEKTDIGVYTASETGDTHTGTATIDGMTDTSDFIVNRRVRVSSGFALTEIMPRIISKDATSITLDTNATADVTGATVEQQSEIRLSENILAGITTSAIPTTWTSGLIIPDGIGAIEESASFQVAGAPAQLSGMSAEFINTSQQIYRWKELGINLSGLLVEVYEFSGTEAASDSDYVDVVFTGTCGDPEYLQGTVEIEFSNKRDSRDAFLGTLINNATNYIYAEDSLNGKMIPLTYGAIDKAKMLRTANTKEEIVIYASGNAFTTSRGSETLYNDEPAYGNIKIFPIVGDDGGTMPTVYNVQIADDCHWDDPADDLEILDFNETFYGRTAYLRVTDGDGKDEVRKIKSVTCDMSTAPEVFQVEVSTVFSLKLAGNATASATNQSFVSIEYHDRGYTGEVWPSIGFLNESDAVIAKSNDIVLYAVDESKKSNITTGIITEKKEDFIRVPSNIAIAELTGNKSSIDIDMNFTNGDVDDINCFTIRPVTGVTRITDSTLVNWISAGASWIATGLKNGYYRFSGVGSASAITEEGSLENDTIDGDADTYYKATLTGGSLATNVDKMGFYFRLPATTDTFDGAFLLFHTEQLNFNSSDKGGNVEIVKKNIVSAAEQLKFMTTSADTGLFCRNFLWSYYGDGSASTDEFFWVYDDYVSSGVTKYYTGHEQVTLASSIDEYNKIGKIGFFVRNNTKYGSDSTLLIYELAVAFKKTISIKDSVFSNFSGRIFNDTWGSRKTSAALIDDPIDILEHVKRLGNWTEHDGTESPGQTYSAAAKINTASTFGGFDWSGLSDYAARRPAFQILDESKARVSAITKDICETYFLTSYIDEDGQECVAPLTDKTSPATTITLAQIVGKIGKTSDVDHSNIFVQPIVRYNYNYGTEKFDGILQIKNVESNTYSANYALGLNSTDGSPCWNLCKALYEEFKVINEPPSNLTDKYMIRTYDDAVWYLKKWLSWMGRSVDGSAVSKKRNSFSVPYTLGRLWHIGTHFKLQLPHITNNIAVECVIEKITKSKQMNLVTVNVILLDAIPTSFYTYKWQDQVLAADSLETYQDMVDAGSPVYQDQIS